MHGQTLSCPKLSRRDVLIIYNASVHSIYPIIMLGQNHYRNVLYPLVHRLWAQLNESKWQTLGVDAGVECEQQGFICENSNIKSQDICLDTEQCICHFEMHPDETPETIVLCIGN